MYICFKCKKEFKFESQLKNHKKNKIPCNQKKINTYCEICNINFKKHSCLMRHEKTKKHLCNIYINGHNVNAQIGDNNLQNIINLTLSINSFKNTDLSYLRKYIINDIGDHLYPSIINKSYLCIQDKVKSLFKGTIEILEFLHFNLNNDDNHNCKILLMFPGIKKMVYEYLILEIETETNKIKWNSLKYNEFINELLQHLIRINEKVKNKNFNSYIKYLQNYLINDTEISSELQSEIETELGELYINFNKNQKKNDREIKEEFEQKILEYQNYRKQECRLNNGYSPDIIDSNI